MQHLGTRTCGPAVCHTRSTPSAVHEAMSASPWVDLVVAVSMPSRVLSPRGLLGDPGNEPDDPGIACNPINPGGMGPGAR